MSDLVFAGMLVSLAAVAVWMIDPVALWRTRRIGKDRSKRVMYSTLEAARRAYLSDEIDVAEFERRLDAALTEPIILIDESVVMNAAGMATLAAEWTAAHSDPAKAHRMMVLPEGVRVSFDEGQAVA